MMPPRRSDAPGSAPRALAKTNPTEAKISSHAGLDQRRAQREADKLVRALRDQLDALEAGEIEFGVAACTIDVIGSLLADIALRGEMVA